MDLLDQLVKLDILDLLAILDQLVKLDILDLSDL